MLYLIGLGLNENGYSREAYDAIVNADKVFLETYTVEFPYDVSVYEKIFEKPIIPADRNFVENLGLVDMAKDKNIVLLIYGSPLSATTHITLIEEAKEKKIDYKVIHGASIFDAVAETGLQLYKFGKVTSMAKWVKEKNFTPDSFIDVVKENASINAHSLILIDIGLDFKDALRQFEESAEKKGFKLGKFIVASRLGCDDAVVKYNLIENFKERVGAVKGPFVFILPSEKLHHKEEEFLKNIS